MPPERRSGAAAPTHRHARLVWSAGAGLLAVAVGLAIVYASALPTGAAGRASATPQVLVAAALVAFDLAMAYVVPWRTRRRHAARMPPDALAAVQTIAASTLALAGGLACCAFFLVTREPLLLPLAVPCAAVLLHWRPSDARWVALGGKRAERPHRMVRR